MTTIPAMKSSSPCRSQLVEKGVESTMLFGSGLRMPSKKFSDLIYGVVDLIGNEKLTHFGKGLSRIAVNASNGLLLDIAGRQLVPANPLFFLVKKHNL
jgi:hypothetical protein